MAKKNGTITKNMSLDSDWQTEDDLRTLSKAAQIKADPKRFKKAMKLAQDQIEALEDLDPVADAKEDKATGEKDD